MGYWGIFILQKYAARQEAKKQMIYSLTDDSFKKIIAEDYSKEFI